MNVTLGLFDKMWKEKNSIINLSLQHLRKLIDNKFKFVLPEDTISRLKVYKTRNNTLLSFIEECCDVNLEGFDNKDRLLKSDFKKAYYRWCDLNNCTKGKLKLNDIDETLEIKFDEKYIIIRGYKYMKNIRIREEAKNELGIYFQ